MKRLLRRDRVCPLSIRPRKASTLFESGGCSVICPVVRGCSSGDGQLLSQMQKNTAKRMVGGKRLDHLKINYSLCRRVGTVQLIDQKYGTKSHIRSIAEYLTKGGFTPHTPIKRTHEQSLALVQVWPQVGLPTIEQHAKAEAAESLHDLHGHMRLRFLLLQSLLCDHRAYVHLLQMRRAKLFIKLTKQEQK